jgi:tetratricopeptide (TPR) repeat protein/predicted Ser/Thr protein kinase
MGVTERPESSAGPESLQATATDLGPDPFAATRHEAAAARPAPASAGLLPCGAQVGRYVILAQLGQGGMGVVYAAYDPELDRKVALKLLAGEAAAQAEDRLQREARAMAQLAHPNVVTVHDVGTLGGRLWIAMEFVDGVTLSDWTRQRRRGWREILAMFLLAGEGLVAAHRAGIVHRDFKPENVMVGADGRARVMDFGIARAGATLVPGEPAASSELGTSAARLGALTQVGAVLGTPRYMAPEQWTGGTIDARTDEFAFCMALWEALFGHPPMAGQTMAEQALAVTTGQFMPAPAGARVPAWVRKACRRGLAVDAAQRFGSMGELLAALRRDPGPRRRALAGVSALVLLTAGVWAGSEVRAARAEAACVAAAEGLETTWNAGRRAEVEAAMQGSGNADAATFFARALPWFELFSQRWSDTAGATCRAATIERTLAPERAWQIAACLDDQRAELDEQIVTMIRSKPASLRMVASWASELSDPRTCSDPTRATYADTSVWAERSVGEMRRGLARIRVLRRSGRLGLASGLVAAIEVRAAAIAAPLVLAEAQYEAGLVAAQRGEFVDARREFEAAFHGAGAVAADNLALEAAQWLCFLVGWEMGEPEVGLAWGRVAEMLLARMHVVPLDRRRAALDADIGVVLMRKDENEAALGRLQRSLATYEQIVGPDDPQIVTVINNLASAHFQRGDYEASLVMFERQRASEAKTLGPESVSVALTRGNIAGVQQALGRFDEARSGYASAATILEKAKGPEHPDVALALLNVAASEARAGAVDEALVHARRALAIREKAVGANNDLVAAALDVVADYEVMQDHLPVALAAHRRALAIYEANHGPQHPELTRSLHGVAEVLRKQGALDEAAVYLRRALAIDEKQPRPAAAESWFALAELALARREYAAAREWFARARVVVDAHYGRAHAGGPEALIGAGEAELGLGEEAAAASLFAAALAAGMNPSPAEVAAARFGLARALWAGTTERPRALTEARKARDALRTLGARGSVALAEVERWLANKGS